MVVIDVGIPFGCYRYINQTVTGNLVQHMLEKRDAGGKIDLPGSVDIYLNANLGLQRIAFDYCFPFRHLRLQPVSRYRAVPL